MNLKSLVQTHKSDTDAVQRARSAGYPAIEPILGDLLEWMQDMNWPVAGDIEELLAPIGAPLSPYVLKVLQGGDDIWKYWILSRLAVNFDREARQPIIDECIRIVNHPTDGELAEEVNLAAGDILILDAHD